MQGYYLYVTFCWYIIVLVLINTDTWEQRKVSDVAKIIAGGTPSTKENSYWEPKEIPWLSSGEVHKKYITFTDDMISQIGMNNSSAKMVAKDSVLIALAGQGKTRGTVAINRIPLTTNQSIAAMTFNENFIPEFVFYNLENRYDELRRMSSGDGSRGGLNKQLVGDIEIPYTEKKEQERIGSFFESLDHIITLHQRKLFLNFAKRNDWEQRKLDDVVEDYVKKTMVENQYPVLTSSQRKGIVLQDEYFSGDRVSQSGNIGYFIIPRGYFAFRSRSDNDVFVFNRNDVVDMGIISYFYPVFKPRGVDSDFLLYRLNYGLENQIKINSEGTGQHVLSLKKFKNMIGLFPSYEEQKRIGTYFSQIDYLITLHQRKCDELKELKKYMLQNMFPQKG